MNTQTPDAELSELLHCARVGRFKVLCFCCLKNNQLFSLTENRQDEGLGGREEDLLNLMKDFLAMKTQREI